MVRYGHKLLTDGFLRVFAQMGETVKHYEHSCLNASVKGGFLVESHGARRIVFCPASAVALRLRVQINDKIAPRCLIG